MDFELRIEQSGEKIKMHNVMTFALLPDFGTNVQKDFATCSKQFQNQLGSYIDSIIWGIFKKHKSIS